MMEWRARTQLDEQAIEVRKGKVLVDTDRELGLRGDWDFRLENGPVKLLKPNGKQLAVYLPEAIPSELREQVYPTLSRIRSMTDNRGLASGTDRLVRAGTRTRTVPVASSIIGSMDANPAFGYCRLTAYTAKQVEGWQQVQPLFRFVAEAFRAHVPDRFMAQATYAQRTHEDWVIPGTPFTTITVNNTYPTGVHTDKGDLDEGFSCLAVLRRGHFIGGTLVFPQYRIGVAMHDGDLLLMDAHEWHGNTFIRCARCGGSLRKFGHRCSFMDPEDATPERVSVVHYYRTKMAACGTPEEEGEKARTAAEARSR